MVADGGRWWQMVADGSRWFQMVPDSLPTFADHNQTDQFFDCDYRLSQRDALGMIVIMIAGFAGPAKTHTVRLSSRRSPKPKLIKLLNS
jgi:hypothetical protein